MTTTPRSPNASPSWWKHALVWATGAGLLAWLLWQVPLTTVLDAWRAPSPATWLLTLLGLATSYLARAWRLQVVLGLDAALAPKRFAGLRLDALRVVLMHNAAVNLLPMRAGELSFPWLASRHLHMPLARSVSSLIWMRLQDLAVLVALGLLFWPGLSMPWRVAALVALVLLWHAGIWLLKALHRRANRSHDNGRGITHRLTQALASIHSALMEPHHHQPTAWALTWANWGIKLAAGAALMSATSQGPWLVAWSGALGGELAAVVPLQGPAGFGTYEAGVWAGFALHWPATSAQMQLAVPSALALHMCFLCCAVLAGLLAWLNPGWSAPRLPD